MQDDPLKYVRSFHFSAQKPPMASVSHREQAKVFTKANSFPHDPGPLLPLGPLLQGLSALFNRPSCTGLLAAPSTSCHRLWLSLFPLLLTLFPRPHRAAPGLFHVALPNTAQCTAPYKGVILPLSPYLDLMFYRTMITNDLLDIYLFTYLTGI